MKKRMLYGFVCLMIMCAFGVVSFCPIASAQSEEEEEMVQPKTNPMKNAMRGKRVLGERAQMQPGEAIRSTENARSADTAQSMGSNKMIGAKGVFTGPASVSRNQKVGTSGHKQDKEGTEDIETPRPLY